MEGKMSSNTKTAVVFPGQGTQRPGMGKDFYDNVCASRLTYEEASDVLGWDVGTMCFGENEQINLTEYAQPCILATEIAMLRGLQELYSFYPDYFGGHSLGEYTALVAAGAMPFADALKTVETRGHLMQEATPPGIGAMAAVIAKNIDIEKIRKMLEDLPVDVANINSTDQVVISGHAGSMDKAKERISGTMENQDDMRFVPLNVSAPFHSRFMNAIKEAFREVLAAISARMNSKNAARVTSNYTGLFHAATSDRVIEALVAQLSGSVKWRDNMQALAAKSRQIYEIGPNRPLKNFFRSLDIQCKSITSLSAAKREFSA
jgi:[acyl-carrier-protein] S-malonyltransferase/trans-AT polyketide synthase/acyltransferase/oxidoreductase domain-containing protein